MGEFLNTLQLTLNLEVIPVESSNLAGIAYDEAKAQLWVAFRNKKIYRYDQVAKEIFEGLLKAESKGKYLNSKIKNKFKTEGYELV